ncbi:dihydroorotate dehydrogenase electron transfer subunit [Gluconacetobacter tumulicola]|uniref:Dihydroorotate dehydrogenase electron transfer subunit n=1 Tax=Gluconacetobacter tumulicola TaxID=1017177 RepID=A0A7W4P9T2_9PROT|nr:dihydroorotate dehydrogenase electron transfer subunit [Gluconacetobacter tumulicola]MBB2180808.1 dihydroorotate dehydrogenase electron transfer subunit [Gluconacetobacter tumulicola]
MTVPSGRHPRPVDEIATIVSHDLVNREYRHMTVRGSAALAAGMPGQFYQIACSPARADIPYLRRPFSLYAARPDDAEIEFLYKVTGEGTRSLALMAPGDPMRILGPLGHGYRLAPHWKHVAVVGRGVGLATLHPLVAAAHARGIGVTLIVSARDAALVPPLPTGPDGIEIHVVTDAAGTSDPARVEALLRDLVRQGRCDAFLTCGSARLLRVQQTLAAEYGLDGQVAMEQQMACGLGMCFCCVRDFRGAGGIVHKRVCWDGPVFDLMDAVA